MKKLTIAIIALMTILNSCSKDDNDAKIKKSRKLQYNVTGTYTGILYASYTTANGGTDNQQITTFPWNKEITFSTNVTAANIILSGNGGVAGQQVTLIIKRGDNTVGSPTITTADASGSFTKAAPVVIF